MMCVCLQCLLGLCAIITEINYDRDNFYESSFELSVYECAADGHTAIYNFAPIYQCQYYHVQK
jgi:hypothetical protein